jgi:uncharacterized protein (DUF1501 family)
MYAAKQEKVVNDKVLVMIQLAGGNDGLQTVIPLADQTYRDMRPQLSKSADEALPISKDFGLNKNLSGTKKLWDDGKLAIVQGVGYPKPSFSHFDSIRVWETADPERVSRTAGSARRSRTTTTRPGTRSSDAPAARPGSRARCATSKRR